MARVWLVVIHRLSMFIKTDARGTVGAYEGGCMCDLNPEYIDGVP